jgi:hypothetical protein
MKTVQKYRIDSAKHSIDMPANAQILSVQIQGIDLMLWALVNDLAPEETRHFVVVGTGQDIPPGPKLKYISTAQSDFKTVVHVFEVL